MYLFWQMESKYIAFTSQFFHLMFSRLCSNMNQYFVSFNGLVIFHWMDLPHFVYPVICWWIFRLYILWLLWIKFLWTFRYKFLYGYIVLVLLDVYVEMILLDHTPFNNLLKLLILIAILVSHISILWVHIHFLCSVCCPWWYKEIEQK